MFSFPNNKSQSEFIDGVSEPMMLRSLLQDSNKQVRVTLLLTAYRAV